MPIPADFCLKEEKEVLVFCRNWLCITALKAQLGVSSLFLPISSCVRKLMAGYQADCTLIQERSASQNYCLSGNYFSSLDLQELPCLRDECFRVEGKKRRMSLESRKATLETSTCSCECVLAYSHGLSWLLALLFGADWTKVTPKQ